MLQARKKVIIVEDELILRFVYCNFLERLGFEIVGQVSTGLSAIEMTRESDPDLIIMDISLPGEHDGIEVMKKIQEFSNVPVIYLTGYSIPSINERAKMTNFLALLSKPIEFDDLKTSVHQYF